MESEEVYYIEKLKEIFADRKKRNPKYSLRSFAYQLKIPVSTLSLVLNGKKSFPQKYIDTILERVELDPAEAEKFKKSVSVKTASLHRVKIDDIYANQKEIGESQFSIIAEWEHYALLSLMELEDFTNDIEYISKKLGITPKRLQTVISNLLNANLIQKTENNKLILNTNPLKTSEDILSEALQVSHKDTLKIANQKLEKVNILSRDYSSITMAIDPSKLTEAKHIIREFRLKMASLLEEGSKKEVYQLAIQLFPLSELEGEF